MKDVLPPTVWTEPTKPEVMTLWYLTHRIFVVRIKSVKTSRPSSTNSPSKSQTTPGLKTKYLPLKTDTGGYHLPRSPEGPRRRTSLDRVSSPGVGVLDWSRVCGVEDCGRVPTIRSCILKPPCSCRSGVVPKRTNEVV